MFAMIPNSILVYNFSPFQVGPSIALQVTELGWSQGVPEKGPGHWVWGTMALTRVI